MGYGQDWVRVGGDAAATPAAEPPFGGEHAPRDLLEVKIGRAHV